MTSPPTCSFRATRSTKTWFGQPRGLTILVLTETWEIFSYFGMRTILVLYLTKGLAFPQGKASLIYGLYTGFVYFTPLIGGPLADRWLGRRRAVLIGAAIMAAGHFMMALPALLYVALATIALGNGLFLPSLPAQIPDLYAPGDPRAKGAMNIYYLGINLGGLAAPFVCGTLGEIYGWHYGFGAAGVGMLVALLVYTAGSRWLPTTAPHSVATRAATALGRDGRERFLLLFMIVLVVVLLRTAYEQVGNTVALWSDSGVDRSFGHQLIPATWFIALNPLLVLAFTPLVVWRWARQARAGREPSTMRKMATGCVGIAAAYLLLALASSLASKDHRASWIWLAAFYTVMTAAELYILPVGLGLFARIAPAGFAATAVAAWFSASFVGNLGAGTLGTLWSSMPPSAFFAVVGVVATIPVLLLLLFDGRVRRAEGDLPTSPEPCHV